LIKEIATEISGQGSKVNFVEDDGRVVAKAILLGHTSGLVWGFVKNGGK
jgi:hypothetical protein